MKFKFLKKNLKNKFINLQSHPEKCQKLFEIKNYDALFSFLNTNKKLRKKIRNVLVNLNYNFSNNKIRFNNLKIDNIEHITTKPFDSSIPHKSEIILEFFFLS